MNLDDLAKFKFEYEDVDNTIEREYDKLCKESGDAEIRSISAKSDETMKLASEFFIR